METETQVLITKSAQDKINRDTALWKAVTTLARLVASGGEMREAHEAEERAYQDGLARAEAREIKILEETEHFMKYDMTAEFIEEWLREAPESLYQDMLILHLNKADSLIGRLIMDYLFKTKYELLDEYYD